MSDETRRALDAAKEKAAEAASQADKLKQECLDAIAAGIAEHVDALAKAAAQDQPDVTRALGKDGVVKFRDELARMSSVVAADVRGAINAIKWPTNSDGLAKNHSIRSAVFGFLYGHRVNSIAAVFTKFGYSTMPGRDGSQHLVLPQELYDETALAPLADVLRKLYKAQAAVAGAKAADDRDVVDDLWGDGPEAARLPGTPSQEW